MRVILQVIAAALVPLAHLAAADWPQFRGPAGDGTSTARNLPREWGGAFGEPAWQTEIPGRGWSSPVVVGDRVWLTSAESLALPTADRQKRLEQGLYKDFQEQFQAHSSVTLYAIEVNVKTGELLRELELFTCEDAAPIHATNTYASPTPATDGQRLYCHFGSLGTLALDLASGRVAWRERFRVDDITGPGSSPVLWRDKLILPCDGADQQFVVALDKLTGQIAWKSPRPKIDLEGKHRRAFSTPLMVEFAGREQLIVPGAQWVCSYDPATGDELWRVNFGDGHATIPRPVYRDGLVYVCTGYMKPKLWAIRVDGRGDVSQSHVAWRYTKQVPEISSPIVVGDELYFVSTPGVATCLDARTGRVHWQERLGGNFAASPIAAEGRILFTSQEGVTTALAASREFRLLARNQLIGQTMASPAIAGEAILIRAERMLYCVGKP